MIRSEALVDYEKFRSAKVAIFVDIGDTGRSYETMARHREAIERLAGMFGARILLVEQKKLLCDAIVESDYADAWILLVSDGPNRSMTTKKNPQRINVDAKTPWEGCAFKELVRQVKESTRILEDMTDYYSRFTAASSRLGLTSVQTSPN